MANVQSHDVIRDFLHANSFWGLPKDDVAVFLQDSVPSFSPEGALYLSSPTSLSGSPNGNGGLFKSLVTSGVLRDLSSKGVRYVFAYSVDNALVRVADPTLIGAMDCLGSDVGIKVVRKTDPNERVGVVVTKNGSPAIVEYGEMPAEEVSRVNSTGDLVHSAGNICIHAFSIPFLERMAEEKVWEKMQLHVAIRNGSVFNAETRQMTSATLLKPELFIFDVFPFAEHLIGMEVDRSEEFSPIKNAIGSDSPATARVDVGRLHKKWIENAGGHVDGDDVEVSPLVSYGGEGLERVVGGKRFTAPLHLE